MELRRSGIEIELTTEERMRFPFPGQQDAVKQAIAARLAAVEALHRRISYADSGDAYCAHDNQWWPCATAAAVRAAVVADPADTTR